MNRNFITGTLLFCSLTTWSQKDGGKEFPEADAIYTHLSCDVNIHNDNGKLSATSDYSEDLLYQSENSVKMVGRGYIYHSGFNELKKWDAYTQRPDEKKKLKTSNASTSSNMESYIFYDDVKSTSFDYSGLVPGATHHLEYELQNNELSLLSPYYFERYFPVEQAELNITFPGDVKLKYIARGMHAGQIAFSESHKKDRTTYTFRMNDLDGLRPYDDAPDNAWYATHLIFYIEQIKENGVWKNYLSSPDDLYKMDYGFIKQLNQAPGTELSAITDSLTKNAVDDRDKAKRIYQWVQNHIKYVAFEEGMEGFIPREASLVCSRRFGDCKDMASILTSMLNYAKIPAYFTWIGTRDIPYDYSDVPLPIVDNHMICTIKLGNDYIFLDATDNHCIFGTPSSGIQGKQAMVSINKDEYKLLRVPIMPAESNTYTDSTFLELNEKGISGHIKVRMKGYYASNMRTTLSYRNEDEKTDYFKKRFGRGNNKIVFTNWKVNDASGSDELTVTADFDLPDYAKKLGDEWFLNLNLFKLYEHQEIDFPKRKMPIEYSFLDKKNFVTSVKIPDGYKAGYIPESESFNNKVWGFVMKYTTEKDRVYLTQEFDTGQMMLTPDQFEPWNKVLEHLFPQYKQSISFQKK